MLCRRLSPDEAHQLVAQLPSMLQQGLDQCVDGPDRKVTIAAIEGELGKVLGLDAKGARAALQAVCKVAHPESLELAMIATAGAYLISGTCFLLTCRWLRRDMVAV